MIAVPEAFAAAAVTRAGDVGRAWVEELPRLFARVCEQWGLAPDGPAMHGYLGLVVPVRRGNEACVLKVSWIDDSNADEAAALAAWNGRGAVQLLEAEASLGALLLERLDHTRSLSGVGLDEAVAIAGRLLRRLAIPAPDGFRPLPVLAESLAATLPERWERAGRPMPRRLLDRACELAAGLGATPARLLVNYDLHYDDVLAGRREPWLAVDPKVVAGDLEFGVAQLLWCRLEEMEAQGGLEHHFRALNEAAELDETRARGWTFVRSVDYWLWGLGVGLTEDPARCALIVERLA
jgi:streptomycin 6-kinase